MELPVEREFHVSGGTPESGIQGRGRAEAIAAGTLAREGHLHGHRGIVRPTGEITGPTINGKPLPGAAADLQARPPHGTVLGDIRCTVQTNAGDVLYVHLREVRHNETCLVG